MRREIIHMMSPSSEYAFLSIVLVVSHVWLDRTDGSITVSPTPYESDSDYEDDDGNDVNKDAMRMCALTHYPSIICEVMLCASNTFLLAVEPVRGRQTSARRLVVSA